MIKIVKLTKYSEGLADRIRALLVQLSRSGHDKGPIPKAWFDELIASPWHDCLLAVEIDDQKTELKEQSKDEESSQNENKLDSQNENKLENQSEFQPSQVLGMASVSVTFGAGIGKNAYLEDFVVDQAARGKGVGHLLFDAYEKWAREKGCKNLEFTCGNGREAAQKFYNDHGATIYDTNFFRKKLV